MFSKRSDELARPAIQSGQHSAQLVETGRVVAVEENAVWIETVRQSSCGQCSLQKGCGQSLIQSMFKQNRQHMRLSCAHLSSLPQVGDTLRIGIPNAAVFQASLLLYLVPLLAFVAAMVIATEYVVHELLILCTAMLAMFIAFFAIRLATSRARFQRAIEPQLLGFASVTPDIQPVRMPE